MLGRDEGRTGSRSVIARVGRSAASSGTEEGAGAWPERVARRRLSSSNSTSAAWEGGAGSASGSSVARVLNDDASEPGESGSAGAGADERIEESVALVGGQSKVSSDPQN